VDSVTHAFAVSLPLLALGSISLIPFAVLGAVIPDIDILFELMPENNPSEFPFSTRFQLKNIRRASFLAPARFCWS
jgi:hypothetical protein